MVRVNALVVFLALLNCTAALAQGPCSVQSSKLACVVPEEFGVTATPPFKGAPLNFGAVLYPVGGHPAHFSTEFNSSLATPLTRDIGSQTNLLPLASPSSGFVLSYDAALKTFVTSTDSLGPILGERAETVGRHRLFIGFSYQYFDFDKIDGVNLHNFENILTHADDSFDNSSSTNKVTCSIGGLSLDGCGFVRDRIRTFNSLYLKENQYTAYVTFGLTRRIDVSAVIPIGNVRLSLNTQATIVPGTNGDIVPTPGSPDQTNPNQCTLQPSGSQSCTTNGSPYFFHLFKDCPNTSPSTGITGLAPQCLNHTFPDPTWIAALNNPSNAVSGSSPNNSATGIGDVVARVKWNAWEGERAGFAAGLEVRFPSGDALNFLGSGAYGFKPFVVFSYRARVSPHVLVGYEWNTSSVTAGDLITGVEGKVPNNFVYSVGADARVTKWLTGDFDLIGIRVFQGTTVAETSTSFLANCGSCTANPTPATVTENTIQENNHASFFITNASMGIKARPFPTVSRLVVTANILVRLDSGGLSSKPVPLVGLSYTF